MFASSVRQLGASLGLYKGSREFQRQLYSVRRLLEDESQIELLFNKIPTNLNKAPQTPYYPAETWVHKDLWHLVDAIGVFSTAWDDFPEFAQNDRRHCLVALEQHLLVSGEPGICRLQLTLFDWEVWLNVLGPYGDIYLPRPDVLLTTVSIEYSPEFLRCVRELLYDTIMELDHVTRRLADFIETGK